MYTKYLHYYIYYTFILCVYGIYSSVVYTALRSSDLSIGPDPMCSLWLQCDYKSKSQNSHFDFLICRMSTLLWLLKFVLGLCHYLLEYHILFSVLTLVVQGMLLYVMLSQHVAEDC